MRCGAGLYGQALAWFPQGRLGGGWIGAGEGRMMDGYSSSAAVRVAAPSQIGIDEANVPVYQQNWWTQIARGQREFREITVEKDGVLVGRLPFMMKRNRFGLVWGGTPDWTHLGGPVISSALSANEKQQVLQELLANLPDISFDFEFDRQSPDSQLIRQAFLDAGFSHSLHNNYCQYPHELGIFVENAVDELGLQKSQASEKKAAADNADSGAGEQQASSRNLSEQRRKIRKANDESLEPIDMDANAFVDFYLSNLAAEGKICHGPIEVVRHLTQKGRERGQIKIFAVRQKAQNSDAPFGWTPDAAIACAIDRARLYLWMMTDRPFAPDSPFPKPHREAIKVAIVRAMKYARDNDLIFDVDGVGLGDTETLYRDRLRIRNLEYRDGFRRRTNVATLFERVRSFAKRFI